jgi:protein NirF
MCSAAIIAACATAPEPASETTGAISATNTRAQDTRLKGTGDLGLIIERASGSIQLINTSTKTSYAQITGLGDLSHASAVYSRDERYAFIFGRDGGLSRVDLLAEKITHRVIQSGNSIGGAISQDGRLVAVSNYTPGGVKVFRSKDLESVMDLPANYKGSDTPSRVVGLVDAPNNKFVFSLFDAGEIWIADFSEQPAKITRFKNIGSKPYDALITSDGRYYIAGLFGEDGLALLDLWNPEKGVRKILPNYGKGEQRLPVYKMPHLEGWTVAGNRAYIPAVGRHEILVVDMNSWEQIDTIPVQGQPIFVMSRPDGRQIWTNFAYPRNGVVQVVDTQTNQIIKTLEPGKAVLHMEFTPRGEQVWVSARDSNEVIVYNTRDFTQDAVLKITSPSGIFFTSRAHQIGL